MNELRGYVETKNTATPAMNELREYVETKNAADPAAQQASAKTEELTEAVLQEVLRMLREELCEEFCAEIKVVEHATQQLTLRVEAQESHFKELTCLSQEVKEKLHMIISRGETSESHQLHTVVEQVQEIQAEHKRILGITDTLTGRCDELFAQIRSYRVCHDDSSSINDQTEVQNPSMHDVSMKMSSIDVQDCKPAFALGEQVDTQFSDLRAQVSWIKEECATFAIKEHVDERISSIHALLSQLKDEHTGDQLAEIRRQMHLVATNWEVMRGAIFTELRKHGATTKERTDKKIAEMMSEVRQHRAATMDHIEERFSKLHVLVSQNMGPQEAKQVFEIDDEQLADQPWEMRGDLEGQRRQSEPEPELSSHGEGALKVMVESTNEQVLQMKKDIEDIRAQLAEGSVPATPFTCIENKIAELLAELRRSRSVTKDLVDERISELELMSQFKGNEEPTPLSRIDEEPLADQLLEIRGDVHVLQRQLLECKEQPSCEEALKVMMERTDEHILQMKKEIENVQTQVLGSNVNVEAIACIDNKIAELVTELRQNSAATKELVDERISELNLLVSKVKGEIEAKLLSNKDAKCMLVQLEDMRCDVDEVRRHLSERSLQPSDGQGMKMECTNGPVLQSKKELEDVRIQLPPHTANVESVSLNDLEVLEEATEEYVALEPFDDALDSQVCACLSPINDEEKVALVEQQRLKAVTQDHVDTPTVSMQVHWSEHLDEGVNDEVLGEQNMDAPERSLRGVHVVLF